MKEKQNREYTSSKYNGTYKITYTDPDKRVDNVVDNNKPKVFEGEVTE